MLYKERPAVLLAVYRFRYVKGHMCPVDVALSEAHLRGVPLSPTLYLLQPMALWCYALASVTVLTADERRFCRNELPSSAEVGSWGFKLPD